MQDEPDGDHQGEEDIEWNGNRKVWRGGMGNERSPDSVSYSRGLVDERDDAQRCVNGDVSPNRSRRFSEAEILRTKRSKEHKEGEGDDPKVHGVDHVAAIKLEREPVSDN